jgi:hypothetical protein
MASIIKVDQIQSDTGTVNVASKIEFPVGSAAAPSIFPTGDTNTGIFFPAADQLGIATNGVERVEFGNSETVFNDGGASVDFRVEGDTEANLLFVDASADRVGIGTNAPGDKFQVAGNALFGTGSSAVTIGGATATAGGATDKNLTLSAWSPTSGTNEYGGNLNLAAGRPIGNGSGVTGSVIIKVGKEGATNSTAGSVVDAITADIATLTFKTSETERMRITSDGKVAVGTTTPYGKLNVSGGTGDDLFAVSGFVGGEVNYNMTIRNPTTNVISFRQRWFTATQNDVEVMNFSSGAVQVIGALSKGSGSFKINHPLKPETHHLIHSFIEGPQADLIYRGKVELVVGRAEVNIDTVAGMTEGTFVALNREVQCFTSNESDWDAVRGSVTGNILTIECQNAESTATISWLVIGERQDQHMYDTDWTDENGKVIVEPLKPVGKN